MGNSNRKDRWLTAEAQAVDTVLNRINHNEEINSRESRGDVAKISRIAGRLPSDDSRATSVAIQLLSAAGLPLKDDYGDDGLTNGERAAVIALSLAAVAERQSYAPNGYDFGHCIGEAARKDPEGSIGDIMKSITYDDDLASLSYDLSRAVRRLNGVKIDFAVLTNDLIRFQNPDKRQRVINCWVKDYYRTLNTKIQEGKEK